MKGLFIYYYYLKNNLLINNDFPTIITFDIADYFI